MKIIKHHLEKSKEKKQGFHKIYLDIDNDPQKYVLYVSVSSGEVVNLFRCETNESYCIHCGTIHHEICPTLNQEENIQRLHHLFKNNLND